MNNEIAAIDFTGSTINICVGSTNKAGQIQAKLNTCTESAGIVKGIVKDIDVVSDTLVNALRKIYSEYGVNIKSAFVNVPCFLCKISHNMIQESVNKPEIDTEYIQNIKNKLLAVEKPEDCVVADIASSKFILDNNMEVRDPYGKSANSLVASTNVISLNSEYFKLLYNLFETAGLQMDGIVMNTLSGLSMLPFSDSERSNIIIINVSWEITDITVCKCGKIVYTDTIQAGAKNIIKDVSIGMNISLEDATVLLKNYCIADPQYIKNDLETSVKDIDGKTVVFKLSKIISFVKDRIVDIYEICLDKLLAREIIPSEGYNVCVYGAEIEKYTGYIELAQDTLSTRIKKIPYALFEVEDIRYGTCAGMIRYVSHHPLLRKESEINVKKVVKEPKKESTLKKILNLLKID